MQLSVQLHTIIHTCAFYL